MKYILYRSYGNIENEDRKHELVAVEYGKDIYEATDSLIRAVSDDLSEMSEYVGCKTTAFAPEMIQSFFKVKKYKYVIVRQCWNRGSSLPLPVVRSWGIPPWFL